MGNSGRRPRRTRRSKQRVGRGFAGGKAQRDGWNRDSWPYEYSRLMASSVVNHRTRSVWLLIEWPESEKEPTKYFLCDLPATYTLRRLVRLAKCRWKIEQDYQQLKEELGLDHYEGRSWTGWHH